MARTKYEFDVIIIGAGTAGLSALKEAKKHTSNVLLVHDGPTATTCARIGCMPSKALIHAAKLYASRHKMKDAGIEGVKHLSPNIPEILKKVRDKRDYFVRSVHERMEPYMPYVLTGKARLEGPNSIRVDGKLLHAKSIVIATGSSPVIPEPYQEFEDRIITTDNLFEQADLPARIGVIGLGLIGLEIAQALAKLGIDITAVDQGNQIGGISDPDISQSMKHVLEQDMRVWLNTEVELSRKGDSILLKGGDATVEVDALLVAVGRKPNIDSLDLKQARVPTDSHGIPHFNNYTMQVPGHNIYLAGDVTDERTILHEAADEGRRAGYHAATQDTSPQPRMVQLSIIFSHPNIAMVGDSHHALRRSDAVIGEASFKEQGRATIENENIGKIRIAADKEDGRIRGGELISQVLHNYLARPFKRLETSQRTGGGNEHAPGPVHERDAKRPVF